ncbi:glycine zipper domain-containing protein [Thermithiobacillus plumbiphilus]|uniref:Glycine zipper domain-containing protein n=1 Tax=Thermithiobacillus plumbiphilus TaxID=1729899 RepID=A0ABU9D7I1_9PROT
MLRSKKGYATALLASSVFLGACASTSGLDGINDATINGSHAQAQGAMGAGAGAVTGAVIGNQMGSSKAGAAIGALVGGAAGYMRGRSLDIKAAQSVAYDARQAGYQAEVNTAVMQNPQTNQSQQVFTGYRVLIPASEIRNQDPEATRILQKTAELAIQADTEVVASGPANLRDSVLTMLNLPAGQAQYVPSNDTKVAVSVMPRRG